MKFLCIYKPAKPEGGLPTPEEMAKMGAYVEESIKSGVLVASEGCLPSALGAKVRRTDGKFSVVDGPFTEAKEVVGGLAVINANSKEHAIEITRSFMNVAGDGEVEVRQLYEVPECGAPRVPAGAETVAAR
ncbi:MAG TPA: YciI family protein [Silvibacterium sp.]|nr:YciI family protein [Silvibacterium sp.]